MRLRLCIIVGVLSCGAAVHATPGLGAGERAASFALKPVRFDPRLPLTQSYFVVRGERGSTFVRDVRIVNTGNRAGRAYVYAVDGTTGQTSGAVYGDRETPRRHVSRWLDLRPVTVTLRPGESRVIRFAGRIPRGARPGDHLGGIVAENARVRKAAPNGSALRINVRQLTVVAVAVQVPGPAKTRLAVTGVEPGGEHGYQYLYLGVRNAGDKTLKPTGTVSVSDERGDLVTRRTFELDTVLPRTAIDYPLLLPRQALEPGGYSAAVQVTYAASPFGYRRASEPAETRSYHFPFEVSAAAREKVYSGAPAVEQPAAAPSAAPKRLLPWLLAAFSSAVALLLIALLALRRWHVSA